MNLLPCCSSNSCSIYSLPFCQRGARAPDLQRRDSVALLSAASLWLLTRLTWWAWECSGWSVDRGSTRSSLVKASIGNVSKPATGNTLSTFSLWSLWRGKVRVTRSCVPPPPLPHLSLKDPLYTHTHLKRKPLGVNKSSVYDKSNNQVKNETWVFIHTITGFKRGPLITNND